MPEYYYWGIKYISDFIQMITDGQSLFLANISLVWFELCLSEYDSNNDITAGILILWSQRIIRVIVRYVRTCVELLILTDDLTCNA